MLAQQLHGPLGPVQRSRHAHTASESSSPWQKSGRAERGSFPSALCCQLRETLQYAASDRAFPTRPPCSAVSEHEPNNWQFKRAHCFNWSQ